MERAKRNETKVVESDVDIGNNGSSGILDRYGSVNDVVGGSEKRGDVYLSPYIDGDVRLYAPVEGPVRWNTHDLSRNMVVDGDVVESFGGYRSVRATHGAYRGTWMYEITVLSDVGEGIGIRLGWSTKNSNLNEPVGANEDGYGFCLCSGKSVYDRRHQTLTSGDGHPVVVKSGDVVACLLHLTEEGRSFEPALSDIVRYKGRTHIRMYPESTGLPKRKSLAGSFVEIFVNGKYQGRAFDDILEGTYYPTVSLFTQTLDSSKVAKVKANFGVNQEGKSPWQCEYGAIYISSAVTKPVSALCQDGPAEDSI